MSFPFRSQLESADCGPACIQMIAAYYGKRVSLPELGTYCHVTRAGISLKDVLEGCRQIGLRAVALHVSKDKIEKMPLPAVLYWRQEHYVVLYRIKRKKEKTVYYIADPGCGKIKLEEPLFIEAWAPDKEEGIAVVTEPEPAFFAETGKKESFKQKIAAFFSAFRYLRGHTAEFVKVLLLSGVVFACSLAIPFLLQKIMDDGIAGKNTNLVVLLLSGQLLLYIGSQLSSAFNRFLLYRTGLQIGLKISSQYIRKLVRLPVSLFDTKLGSDLLLRLADEEKIRNFLTYTASSLLFILLNLAIYSCVLFYYNSYVFAVFSLFMLVSVAMTRWLLKVRKQLNYAFFVGLGKKKNIENELVYGMLEIKINSAHRTFLSQWEKLQREINVRAVKNMLYETGISSGTTFIGTLRDLLITGGCAYFVIGGEMSVGVMLTVTYILGQLTGSVSQLLNFSHTSQDASMAYERIDNILQVADENTGKDITVLPPASSGFELDGIFFKYEGTFNPYVLHDIRIEIPRGKVTAIVGASGSGKTTLLKLLLAFYYPQRGSIRLGGTEMNRLDPEAWRKKCGVVMQDGYIFSGTVADNITLSDQKPDRQRMEQAARIACIDEFIDRLPMKYHTKIGRTGTDLSGGQKQRLLIARAVYKDPDYIFFDEATSSLDAGNEKEIMEKLKTFYRNRTVVVIAHRLSTVKDADRIIVLDKGRVIEQGTHAELTSARRTYYRLVKNQLELGR